VWVVSAERLCKIDTCQKPVPPSRWIGYAKGGEESGYCSEVCRRVQHAREERARRAARKARAS
jgi:hypothetical protein